MKRSRIGPRSAENSSQASFGAFRVVFVALECPKTQETEKWTASAQARWLRLRHGEGGRLISRRPEERCREFFEWGLRLVDRRRAKKSPRCQGIIGSVWIEFASASKLFLMLLARPSGTGRVQSLATRLGCNAGELSSSYGRVKPALPGSVSGHSSVLRSSKDASIEREKVYLCASWPTLEAALQHIVDERKKERVPTSS
ncbi:hypothetical protein J2W27_004426 [Variovorax boronicumulans]|uniref:hypothetical protein n=1 Tax=Variovorax boronicumulans TaxID=436515 RepID=UPI0027870C81|nr:hypothetical protein [Variovorax boronicumulans]MDP9912300.1 hypothetical protein [Variovorax boronicumulans]